MILCLFGATAGQSVVWYAGQFYALFFLTTTLKVDYVTAYELIAVALVLGGALVVLCGKLSDRFGRKPVMLLGLLLTVTTYQPIFHGLARNANPALTAAMARAPVVLETKDYEGPTALAFAAVKDAVHKIVLPSVATSQMDQARNYLNDRGIPFALAPARADIPLMLSVGGTLVTGFDRAAYEAALAPAGYPKGADPAAIHSVAVVALLTLLVGYVALVYGPIAAFLVELFPARIRYTSMSLPYHIGNGWFGGFLPLIAASIVLFTGDIYAGLWYPILVAAMSLMVGAIFLPETNHNDINQ